MTDRFLLALLAPVLFAAGALVPPVVQVKAPERNSGAVAEKRDAVAQAPVTVFLVRHAEKRTDDPQEHDPELTEAGHARSRTLSRMLGHAGVTHLFSTDYRRTRDTLAPLAEKLGLQLEIIDARSQDEQVAALRRLPPGSVAVVSGHSNTTPALVQALGGDPGELEEHARYGKLLPDNAYDRLFGVVLTAGGAVQTLELRYGE